MLKNIEAVIFDLDGTLLDSMWIWPSIDDAFLAKFDLKTPAGFHDTMEGMSFTEAAAYFRDSFSLPMSLEEIKNEWLSMTYDKYTMETTLKPGALEFLQRLKKAGIKLGIATSNTKQLVADTLKAHHIYEIFDSIRTSCEVAAGKPSPDVYLKVAEDLCMMPHQCLVFEDVPNGIRAGKSAGMTVCAIEDDYTLPQTELKKELADYYIRDFHDIADNTYEVLA